ncbi:hypothetical protein FAIPA1_70201 [Frankia sp. AiPs1]
MESARRGADLRLRGAAARAPQRRLVVVRRSGDPAALPRLAAGRRRRSGDFARCQRHERRPRDSRARRQPVTDEFGVPRFLGPARGPREDARHQGVPPPGGRPTDPALRDARTSWRPAELDHLSARRCRVRRDIAPPGGLGGRAPGSRTWCFSSTRRSADPILTLRRQVRADCPVPLNPSNTDWSSTIPISSANGPFRQQLVCLIDLAQMRSHDVTVADTAASPGLAGHHMDDRLTQVSWSHVDGPGYGNRRAR